MPAFDTLRTILIAALPLQPCAIKDIDLNVATVDDYRTISVPFSCPINLDSQVSGFAGVFVLQSALRTFLV